LSAALKSVPHAVPARIPLEQNRINAVI